MTRYQDLLADYLASARGQVSAQGYGSLAKRTRQFLAWVEAEDRDLLELGISDAVHYQAYLGSHVGRTGAPYCPGTIHNHLKAARRLGDYLVQTGKRASNPFADLRYPRLPAHLSANVLTEAQMGRLLGTLAAFDTLPTPTARIRRYRVHVVAEFLYATGLRIAEAASIPLTAVDLETRRIYLPQGKGGRPRTVFLHRYAADILSHFLSRGRALVLGDYGRSQAQTLFATHRERLACVVNAELQAVCRATDLPVITSHAFRHSLGTHLLRSGCDLRHIQVILGHESLASTQIYTRVDKDDLKRSVDQFHPRQWRHGPEAGA
jgi:site-specific recombinase XerD